MKAKLAELPVGAEVEFFGENVGLVIGYTSSFRVVTEKSGSDSYNPFELKIIKLPGKAGASSAA